jgi:hypothetical protein
MAMAKQFLMMAGKALSCDHSVKVGSVQARGSVALLHDIATARQVP